MSNENSVNNNSVIVGKSNSGDFVLQSQELATNDGFRNVAKIWYKQTLSVDEGLEQLEAGVAEREDLTLPFGNVVPAVEGSSMVLQTLDGQTFKPTQHAILQYASICGVPHTFVNAMVNNPLKQNGDEKFTRDSGDAETLVTVFENGIRRVQADKPYLFRTYKDGTLRAVLSKDYSRVDNRWYLKTMGELLPGCRLSHWKGDADTIFGNILIPDTMRAETDSDYGGMLSVGNCEIGRRPIFQLPSVFRAICMNGCIWGQEKGTRYRQIHRGIDFTTLRAELADNINSQIPLLAEGVERFLALHSVEVTEAKLTNVFAQIAIDNTLTPKQNSTIVESFLKGDAKEKTAFGVVNAITRAGQLHDPETWYKFDTIAGGLMNLSVAGWEALQKRAANMPQKQYDKIYGSAV